MRKLIETLNYHTDLYNKGCPILTDKAWDDMYFELQELEKETGIVYPDSPTQRVRKEIAAGLQEEILSYKMLSLAKTKSLDEINSFFKGKEYIAMLKLDGLSLQLRYSGGGLAQAITRGDGYVGSDVTHNAKVIKNIPQKINYKEDLIVCGEVICKTDDFVEFADKFANSRNFASGSLKLLDANECARRNLSFVAWDIQGQENKFETLKEKLDFLSTIGFETVAYAVGAQIITDKEVLEAKWFAREWGYPIDGLVFKINDCANYTSLGETSHSPLGALAFKFYDEVFETTLIDIEWSMGGRNGQIIPVAIFEPVEFDDAVCERASLHNISVIKDIFNGMPFREQKIKVAKVNQIIPQLVDAMDEKGEWINETKVSGLEV